MDIYKRFFYCVFTLAILVFSFFVYSLAWFARSTSVTTGRTDVAMAGAPFTIAAVAYPAEIGDGERERELFFADGTKSVINGKELYLASENSRIRLRAEDIFNDDEESKLYPGSYGKLEFCIIPNQELSSDSIITLHVGLTPYCVDSDNTISPISDESVVSLVNGHLLLFTNKDGERYNGLIDDGLLELTVHAGQPYTLYTLYWIWPPYFENYIIDTMTASILCTGDDYDALLNDIVYDIESREISKYFIFKDIHRKLYDNGNLTNINYYHECYNLADEQIGNCCDGVLLQIDTKPIDNR